MTPTATLAQMQCDGCELDPSVTVAPTGTPTRTPTKSPTPTPTSTIQPTATATVPGPVNTTYSFDDITGDYTEVNDVHAGIDFGRGKWRSDASWGGLTRCGYFYAGGQTLQTFTLPVGAVLKSIRFGLGASGSSDFRLGDGINPDKIGTLVKDQPITVVTGWTQPAAAITVYFSAGWDAVIDEIAYTRP